MKVHEIKRFFRLNQYSYIYIYNNNKNLHIPYHITMKFRITFLLFKAIHIHRSAVRCDLERFVSDFRSGDSVQRLSPEQVYSMTKDGQLQERILLEGQYFVPNHGWMSMPVSKHTVRFASTIGEIHVSYKQPSDGRRHLMAVSFGGVMKIGDGVARVDICYYGEDEVHFYDHVASHLQHTLCVTRYERMAVIVRQPLVIDRHKVGRTLARYMGDRVNMSEIEDIPTAYLMTINPQLIAKL